MRILRVEWIDAADVTDSWTQGAVEGHLVIAQSVCGDMVDNVMQIPLGMVGNIVVIG